MSFDVIPALQQMIAQLPRTQNPLLEIDEALAAHPEFQPRGSFTFQHNELEITHHHADFSDARFRALEWVRPLELTIAPKLVALLPIDDKASLMVSSYWACPGERLIGGMQLKQPLSQEACERFRGELRRLAERGYMHTYVRGFPHWLVGERTGTLMLNAWHSLQPCDAEEIAKHLELADVALQHRGWAGGPPRAW